MHFSHVEVSEVGIICILESKVCPSFLGNNNKFTSSKICVKNLYQNGTI